MNFSLKYSTYEDWLTSFKGSSSYRERIIREHAKYPKASLSQLRGHASRGKKSVSDLKPIPVYKRSWSALGKRELSQRERSLDVLMRVKKGASLTQASKRLHTTSKSVLKQTNAFRKVKGRYIPKDYDRISRVMSINEEGKRTWIDVRDSRTASKIGRYNSSVNEFLMTGDSAKLDEFRDPIKDAQERQHYLETNTNKIYEIEESIEEPEFFEIYKIK